MNVVPLAIVLVLGPALVGSMLVGLAARAWRSWRNEIDPIQRTRMLLALLAAPAVMGVATLLLGFGPCLETLVRGLPDECRSHGGPDYTLCFFHPGRATWVAWTIAALAVAWPALRTARLARAMWIASHLLGRLNVQTVATPQGEYRVIPGGISFAAGLAHGNVYVGKDLANQLERESFEAVLAHERAHVRRGDVRLRLLARALGVAHVPWIGAALLAELDLAIEQVCDREASNAVHDPLIVAQALVSATRLAVTPLDDERFAGFAGGALEARIGALCEPPWHEPAHSQRWISAVGACAIALGIVFDRHVHDAAEALVGLLGR